MPVLIGFWTDCEYILPFQEFQGLFINKCELDEFLDRK